MLGCPVAARCHLAESHLQLISRRVFEQFCTISSSVLVADKAWAGVFEEATDRRVERFTESVSFDRRLYAHDIRLSLAHAQMLAKVGLLTDDECRQIEQALNEIRQEIEQGRFEFRIELEDVHMHI